MEYIPGYRPGSKPSNTVNGTASTSSAPPPYEPHNKPLTQAQIDAALSTCLSLQVTATTIHGKRPFAALLLAPDNTTVLLTHYSISHVQHAESELARLATIHFSQDYLWGCTLISTWEPCAMCTGTLYWSNIGRLVYAASEDELRKLTGGGNEENMTMSLPCRDVIKHGQKRIKVVGPLGGDLGGWEEKVVVESKKWWDGHNKPMQEEEERRRKVEEEESIKQRIDYNESVYSVQHDDGEYEADLRVDWLN